MEWTHRQNWCCIVKSNWFEGLCVQSVLNARDFRVSQLCWWIFKYCGKTKALRPLETSATIYQSTQRHIPKDLTRQCCAYILWILRLWPAIDFRSLLPINNFKACIRRMCPSIAFTKYLTHFQEQYTYVQQFGDNIVLKFKRNSNNLHGCTVHH
jgi:hypothetical protein